MYLNYIQRAMYELNVTIRSLGKFSKCLFRKSHKLSCHLELAPLAHIEVPAHHGSTEKCSHHRKPTQLDPANSNYSTHKRIQSSGSACRPPGAGSLPHVPHAQAHAQDPSSPPLSPRRRRAPQTRTQYNTPWRTLQGSCQFKSETKTASGPPFGP